MVPTSDSFQPSKKTILRFKCFKLVKNNNILYIFDFSDP